MYAAWVDRYRWAILGVSLLIAATGAWLASTLPVRADISNLLPPSEQSVQDLEVLKKRAKGFGTIFVVVRGDSPEARERAAALMADHLPGLDPALISNIAIDDAPIRRYFWENRFLFADLAELEDARDALADSERRARLDANPLFVDLDDDDDEALGDEERLTKLRQRLDDAEAKRAGQAQVSKDGRIQVFTIRTNFASADPGKAGRIIDYLEKAGDEVMDQVPGVEIGLTGNVVSGRLDYEAVLKGMVMAAAITILLVALALFFYYRSGLAVSASLYSLAVGTLATFAFVKVSIGHLNMMTAFLAAIVVGNGINAGLMLLARYFEELRAGGDGTDALGRAIRGAARGTLAASLTAGVAYGSLAVTDFRGFRHFGVMAGAGMLLCWLSAFVVLPAALCVLRRRGWLKVGAEPPVGHVIWRMLPRRRGVLLASVALLTLAAGVVAGNFLFDDPFLEDWRELKSDNADLRVERGWDRVIGEALNPELKQGLSGRFVVALDDAAGIPALVETLRAVDRDKPPEARLMTQVRSLQDALPSQQADKIEVLEQIRELLDDDLMNSLSDDDRALAQRVKPPDDLMPLTLADIPDEIAWPFTEKDGTLGRLIVARSAPHFDPWNVSHRVAFANGVRAIDLPPDAKIGGQAFVVADIIKSMHRDAPLAIGVALIGSILAVWLVVGLGRHGLVTIACGTSGIVIMIGVCALAGLKVHFLDLIALPITIGIGIDYAVNLAARQKGEPLIDAQSLLATTGGAVLLCSFTTTVGYGSLLLSDNAGIRSFGLASIIGEIACVFIAMSVAPALLARMPPARTKSPTGERPAA